MITDILLEKFNKFLSVNIGLYFTKDKWPQLKKGLTEAAREFGCETPEKCLKWLMSANLTEKQVEILAGYLTVGETYFFREKKTFDILENIILPEFIRTYPHGPKSLRVWSAACSTGEEAYSIAIVLDKKKEELKDFNIFILATDINYRALKTAKEGVYGEWSFRDTPKWLKEIYFTQEGKNRYKIQSHLRNMITFDYFNLVENDCLSHLNNFHNMDIIFCRNVLMYFEPQIAKKVAENLFRCLTPGGWLIASPTDAFNISPPGLLRLPITEAPVFRKMPPGAETDKVQAIIAPATLLPGDSFRPTPTQPAASPLYKETAKVNDTPIKFHYKEALELYRQGFYAKAAEILESLLSSPIKPKLENVGNLDDMGDMDDLHDIDDIDEIETRVFQLLARVNANQGKLETAEKWCLKAIDSAKLNIQCHYLLAIIRLEQGKIEEARTSLQKSLYIDPNFIPAHFTLGHIALHKKNYLEAKHYFDNCLSLLNNLDSGEKVMELGEGMTAGRLKKIIIDLKKKESIHG